MVGIGGKSMSGIIQLNILQFSLIYLLLIVVLALMKRAKINQTKLLLLGTVRMTVQLVLAGFILTYIFANPHPLFTIAYIAAMVIFSIARILNRNKWLNKSFKIAVSLSLTPVSYTHLRAHETRHDLVCRLLLEKKKQTK